MRLKIRIFALVWMTIPWIFAQDPIKGATVFNLNCARCHQARPAHEFSDREWDVIVPHMREKAHLTKTEADNLTHFLQQSNLPENIEMARIAAERPVKSINGEELVARFACAGCHIVKGKGGTLGPSLDGISDLKDGTFLRAKIANPQFNNPSSPMPQFSLSKEEVEAIIDYLKE